MSSLSPSPEPGPAPRPGRRRRPARAPHLVTLVARRILLFAGLASLIQTGVVFADYWSNTEELGRLLIEQETTLVHQAVSDGLAQQAALPGARLADRYRLDERDGQGGYYLRVRDGTRTLWSNCGPLCQTHFLPEELDAPTFWMTTLSPGRPLFIAGGRTFPDGIVVEIAILGDPARLVAEVLWHEMFDHMVVPMGLMLFLVIGATILSIRRALTGVGRAAAAADAINPAARGARAPLPVAGLPREIGRLTDAVNRAFDRIEALVRAQTVLAGAVAHEIRTPLAVMQLELSHIDDPRAREAERSVAALAHTVAQLTALARLDAADPASRGPADLAALAEAGVEAVAPLVFAAGDTLSFEAGPAAPVSVLPGAVELLVRNLVENAVRHTARGTAIRVCVEAPARLVVGDDGGGMDLSGRTGDGGVAIGTVSRAGSLGMGLKIVERIAALHGARLSLANEAGLTVTIEFPPAAAPDGPAVGSSQRAGGDS